MALSVSHSLDSSPKGDSSDDRRQWRKQGVVAGCRNPGAEHRWQTGQAKLDA